MANRSRKAEDPRLRCVEADGGGHHAEYKIEGRDDVMVIYERDNDPYPWCPVRISNGRMVSGYYNEYSYSSDLVDAILDGSAWS